MTALNSAIKFNSSTGSTTAASGVGPATAVTGSGASTTASSAVVTGINTTGVSAGDLLWVSSSSGRQFSAIASVDSGTQVTCDDTFANTESGRTWAIGGKRAQLFSNASSKRLWENDSKAGWVIELESGYTETFSTTIDTSLAGNSTDGRITVRGATGGTKPVITYSSTGGGIILRGASTWRLENFDLLASGTAGTAIDTTTSGQQFWKIKCGKSGSGSWNIIENNGTSQYRECEFSDCRGVALTLGDGSTVKNCTIVRNGSHGISFGASSLGPSIEGCIIADNAGDGINWGFTGNDVRSGSIVGNIITGNTGDGIELTAAPSAGMSNLRISENIITENGGYGINASNGSSTVNSLAFNGLRLYSNAFGTGAIANTSGKYNPSGMLSTGEIELTADPFEDAASDDYNINNDAGGGALLRAATVTMPG